jgi:hypothetical protein
MSLSDLPLQQTEIVQNPLRPVVEPEQEKKEGIV